MEKTRFLDFPLPQDLILSNYNWVKELHKQKMRKVEAEHGIISTETKAIEVASQLKMEAELN